MADREPAGDETLKPNDAVKVLEEILEAQNRCYALGLLLKVPEHIVERLHKQYPNPCDCLLHVLIEFTKQTNPRPTWRLIVDALKSPAINLSRLAEEVESAHFPECDVSQAVSSTVSSDDVSPKFLLSSTPSVPELQTTEPPQKKARAPSVPELQTTEPPQKKAREMDGVKARIDQFNNRFHQLKNSTREYLEKQKIPVNQVADALTSLPPDAGEVHAQFLKSHFDDLFDAADHTKLFGKMNFHWNYLNYHMLDHLVKRFDIKEVRSEMEVYKSDLKSFREVTPLNVFCKTQRKKSTKPQKKFRKVVAEFNWPDNKEVTLEVVEEFRQAYAHYYSLWEFAMMLEEVRPGSFIVTWLVPESVIGMLHVDIPIELLKEFFVTELEVAGVSVYQWEKSKFQTSTPSSSGYSSYPSTRSSSDHAPSERGQPEPSRNCIEFKLLGKCENSTCCFDHSHRERTVHSTVEIPDKVPIRIAMKGAYARQLQQIADCCFRAAGKNLVDIVVSSQNAHFLTDLVKEYKVLLSQLYPRGLGWRYIHHDGIAQCSLLEFKHFEGNLPVSAGEPRESRAQQSFELCFSEADSDEYKSVSVKEPLKEPSGDSDTEESLHKALAKVHGEEKFDPRSTQRDFLVMFIEDHKGHIKRKLKEGLEWFYKEKRGFVLKLEGRFGKVLWNHLPKEMCSGPFWVKELESLCSSDDKYSRLFAPDVKHGSADAIKRKLQEEKVSELETFDIKFTIPREEKRRNAIDVRVKFEQGRPKVLLAKKNEAKIVLFDVLYLHRNHDIRMSPSYYEMVQGGSTEYAVIEKLLKTMALSELDETITLVTKTEDWCVNYIRHKKRETYHYKDKYLVTITDVAEYQLRKEHQRNEQVPIFPDYYNERRTECEFHNCSWECAFGRDVDFSPEKSLVLLMDPPSVTPEVARAIPHPWQPEDILQEFQEFWENLDALNDMLGPSP